MVNEPARYVFARLPLVLTVGTGVDAMSQSRRLAYLLPICPSVASAWPSLTTSKQRCRASWWRRCPCRPQRPTDGARMRGPLAFPHCASLISFPAIATCLGGHVQVCPRGQLWLRREAAALLAPGSAGGALSQGAVRGAAGPSATHRKGRICPGRTRGLCCPVRYARPQSTLTRTPPRHPPVSAFPRACPPALRSASPTTHRSFLRVNPAHSRPRHAGRGGAPEARGRGP